MNGRTRRFTLLDLCVLVLVVASVALTATIRSPRTDDVRLLGFRIQKLLAAQTLGQLSLVLLGVAFLRRPRLRSAGWIVLALALAGAAVLADIYYRVYVVRG